MCRAFVTTGWRNLLALVNGVEGVGSSNLLAPTKGSRVLADDIRLPDFRFDRMREPFAVYGPNDGGLLIRVSDDRTVDDLHWGPEQT